MTSVRLLIDAQEGGAWNMAVDHALLETAAETGAITLRFYEWTPATLSLGYFQPVADRLQHAASAACPIVRRSTGGGAIVHDQELTYSLVAPVSSRFGAEASALATSLGRSRPWHTTPCARSCRSPGGPRSGARRPAGPLSAPRLP